MGLLNGLFEKKKSNKGFYSKDKELKESNEFVCESCGLPYDTKQDALDCCIDEGEDEEEESSIWFDDLEDFEDWCNDKLASKDGEYLMETDTETYTEICFVEVLKVLEKPKEAVFKYYTVLKKDGSFFETDFSTRHVIGGE